MLLITLNYKSAGRKAPSFSPLVFRASYQVGIMLFYSHSFRNCSLQTRYQPPSSQHCAKSCTILSRGRARWFLDCCFSLNLSLCLPFPLLLCQKTHATFWNDLRLLQCNCCLWKGNAWSPRSLLIVLQVWEELHRSCSGSG